MARFVKIQTVRFGIIPLSIIPPLYIFLCFLYQWEFATIGLFCLTYLLALIALGLIALSAIYLISPEFMSSGIKAPYLMERIKVCKRKMYRNLVLFSLLSIGLTHLLFKMADNRPGGAEFEAYLQQESTFSQKDILEEFQCALFTVHILKKGEENAAFVGAMNRFIPISPFILNDNPELILEQYKLK